MSKQIDTIKLIKYKNSRLKGNSKSKALIDSGTKPNTANAHCSDYEVVKRGEIEIKNEFKLENLTANSVMSSIALGKQLALTKSDLTNYAVFCKLEGQYLALFTDKYKQEGDLPPPNYIINTINTNKDIKRDIPQAVVDDVNE